MYSDVRIELSGPGRVTAAVRLIDSAGLSPQVGPLIEPMAPGQRQETGGFVREGLDIQGFPATCEDGGPQGVRRLQVRLSTRLRLTLQSAASRDALVAAVNAIDLKALTRLAPDQAAAPSDLKP
jgi:hypothetical protein